MRSNDLTADEVECYADGEMSAEAAAEADRHIAGCARCAAAVVSLLQMKRAIRDAHPQYEAPAALRARVMAETGRAGRAITPLSIAPPLPRDLTTRADATRPQSRRSRAPQWIASAAIVVLVIVGLGLLRARAVATTREFADLHATLLASASPVEVISTDRHTVKPWFEGRVPFAVPVPELTGTPFHLIGGRVIFRRNTTGAYLLVAKGAHRISLFVFPADVVPTGAPIPAVSTLSWRTGGLSFTAVADVSQDDLIALRRAFGQ
jgi:anti-sigma factor RsiW